MTNTSDTNAPRTNTPGTGAVRIAVCLKWVAHPGEPDDERFSGMSSADASALEWALRQSDHIRSLGGTAEVTAITVGPAGADRVVRDAVARGAHRAVRVEAPKGTDSADVATALASALAGWHWFWCGDYSADRGTGSVPAFLAAATGARQALGVIDARVDQARVDQARDSDLRVSLTRRLDGGRRELLDASAPAVVSVEGATAPLRRASLPAVRAAAAQSVEVVHPGTPVRTHDAVVVPYRPRARVLPAPVGDDALDRLRVLTDAAAASAARGETVDASPAEAAARIVSAVRAWGYLE